MGAPPKDLNLWKGSNKSFFDVLIYCQSFFLNLAAAFIVAIDTAIVVFPPKTNLLTVPSNCNKILSSFFWSKTELPIMLY